MNWSVITASNNNDVLESCLLASPDLRYANDVVIQNNCCSAASAYNSGMDKSNAEFHIFAHQDVYLPEGWINNVRRAIDILSHSDPNWGVLGVWGVTKNDSRAGYLYWTGIKGVAGKRFDGGIEVESLDELLLIIRRSSGLRFDEFLPGFHMYGADICCEAERRGMKSYAISAFCIHNTNEYKMLPLEFWKAYKFMRKKWRFRLPIRTTCIKITRWCWPVIQWNIVRTVKLALCREKQHTRVEDPGRLYQDTFRRRIYD